MSSVVPLASRRGLHHLTSSLWLRIGLELRLGLVLALSARYVLLSDAA